MRVIRAYTEHAKRSIVKKNRGEKNTRKNRGDVRRTNTELNIQGRERLRKVGWKLNFVLGSVCVWVEGEKCDFYIFNEVNPSECFSIIDLVRCAKRIICDFPFSPPYDTCKLLLVSVEALGKHRFPTRSSASCSINIDPKYFFI